VREGLVKRVEQDAKGNKEQDEDRKGGRKLFLDGKGVSRLTTSRLEPPTTATGA